MIFVSGDKLSSPDSVSLPSDVLPGQTVELSMNLVAPDTAGRYQGNWEFEAPNGKVFGAGDTADQPIWVRIRVITPSINTGTVTPTPSPVGTSSGTATPQITAGYDFVENACAAQWENSRRLLPCPGLDGNKDGFVLLLDQARLEDGSIKNLPTLLTFPEFTKGGSVQGLYPDYLVQAGDHLQTGASCESGSKTCSVLYQISYIDSAGAKNDLWTVGEFYDGLYSNADIDLSRLAGMKVKFVLSVTALGAPTGDRALWVAPHIVHLQPPTPTATTTAIVTATASPSLYPTATPTNTLAPTATHRPTPTPTTATAGAPSGPPSAPGLLDQIISFFRKLFGR